MSDEIENAAEAVIDATLAGAVTDAHEARERAEETAAHIAEAAMEGERARRIESLEKEMGEWSMKLETTKSELTSRLELLATETAMQTATLLSAVAAVQENLTALAVSPNVSIPPILEEAPKEAPKEAEVTTPSDEAAPPVRKKKHLFL